MSYYSVTAAVPHPQRRFSILH